MGLKLSGWRTYNQKALLSVSIFVLAASSLTVMSSLILNKQASAASTVQVSQNSTDWIAADTRPGGATAFSAGFNAPTGLGSSALKVTTSGGSAKAQKFHGLPASVPLRSVNDISYWSYRSSASTGSAVQVAAVNLVLDYNGPAAGGFTTLVLEPVYQTHQAPLMNNTWQLWSGGNQDIWWSSNPIPGAPNRDTFVTLQTIKDNNPEATVSAVGFNQGSGNDGIVSAVDGLTFNGTTYNFEAALPAFPENLRLNGDKPCEYITNVNWITPTWNEVPGAASYNYKVTLPNGSTYGPTNVGNVTSVSGAFGGEGRSTFSVQTVDASGFASEWAPECGVTYDKTAPSIPQNGNPRNNTLLTTNDFYFTWNASSDAAAITYEFQSSGSGATDTNGSLIGAWNSIASGNSEQNNLTSAQIHSTGAPDGHYFWQVRALDAAGNKSAWSTVWDMRIDQKPAAPVLGVTGLTSGSSTTNQYSVTATWNKPSDDTARYQYQYWNSISGNPYKKTSPYTVDVYSESRSGEFTEGEGTHYLRVRAIDAAGTPSEWSNEFEITYDKTAPTVSLDNIATVTEGDETVVSGTVSDATATQVDIFVDGVLMATVGVNSGTFSAALILEPGSYVIVATARDAASNQASASDTAVVTEADTITDGNTGTGNGTGTGTGDNGELPSTNNDQDDETDADLIAAQTQIFRAPLIAVEDSDVLGEQDSAESDTEKSAVSDQDIMGVSDTKEESGTFSLLGFAWYWWLVVLGGIAGLWWLLAALRRQSSDS